MKKMKNKKQNKEKFENKIKKDKIKKKKILKISGIILAAFIIFSFLFVLPYSFAEKVEEMQKKIKTVSFLMTALTSVHSLYVLYKTLKNIGTTIKQIKGNILGMIYSFKPKEFLEHKEIMYASYNYLFPTFTVTFFISYAAAIGLLLAVYWSAGDANEEHPLPSSKYCHLCNWDPYTVCTKERCNILGNCFYQPLESEIEGICLPQECEEGLPKIKKMKVKFFNGSEQILEKTNNNCPDEFGGCKIDVNEVNYDVTHMNISFETNINASCGYSFDPQTPFEKTTLLGNEELYFPKVHSATIYLVREGSLFERGKIHQIFIKCRSTCDDGVPPQSFDENYIKFKIEEWPDFLPPDVKIDPENGIVSEEEKYITIYLYLDKEGYCGYSTNHFKLNYTDNFDINNDCSLEMNVGQYMCHFGTKLEGDFVLDSKCENKVCWINISLDKEKGIEVDWNSDAIKAVMSSQENSIECPSQEINQQISEKFGIEQGLDIGRRVCDYVSNVENFDLGMMEGVKNNLFPLKFRCANKEGYLTSPILYGIVTMPGYDIIILSPQIGYKTYYRNLLVNVTTVRNSNFVPTYCKYSLDDNLSFEDMVFIECNENDCISLSWIHEGYLENLSIGNHTLYIKCRDIFGLQEETSIDFEIIPPPLPKIIRMWIDEQRLFIETDIPADCIYNDDDTIGCEFNETQAENMSKINEYIFNNYALKDKNYYVKCIDEWHSNSLPSECTSIIRPFEIPIIH